jgi:hypothetical protein
MKLSEHESTIFEETKLARHKLAHDHVGLGGLGNR